MALLLYLNLKESKIVLHLKQIVMLDLLASHAQ